MKLWNELKADAPKLVFWCASFWIVYLTLQYAVYGGV